MGKRGQQRLRRFLLSAVFLFAVAPPLAADAKPGYVVTPGEHWGALKLRGTHGYKIQITETSRGLSVQAYKSSIAVIYGMRHSPAKGDGIDAELPGVGRVSLQFHPVGSPNTEPGFFPAWACNGGETIKQPGYFLGTVRLRGERGYTTVHASRRRGQVVTTIREVCKRSIFNEDNEPEPEEEVTHLQALSRSKGRLVGFYASTPPFSLHPYAFFWGFTSERRQRMMIFREAAPRGSLDDLALGDVGDFPFSATVTPPPPFHGSGNFQRLPGGDSSWTGSLSVNLPGAGRVALAGRGFSAKLCHDAGCRRRSKN